MQSKPNRHSPFRFLSTRLNSVSKIAAIYVACFGVSTKEAVCETRGDVLVQAGNEITDSQVQNQALDATQSSSVLFEWELDEKRIATISLKLLVDGMDMQSAWQNSVQKAFRFADLDENSKLDPDELEKVIAPIAIQQIQWGQFAPVQGEVPKLESLDRNGDGDVDVSELQAWYESFGLGRPSTRIVSFDSPEFNTASGVAQEGRREHGFGNFFDDVLFRIADVNQDDTLDISELETLSERLTTLDRNGDKALTLSEIVGGQAAPRLKLLATLRSVEGKDNWSSDIHREAVTYKLFDATSQAVTSSSDGVATSRWEYVVDLESLRDSKRNALQNSIRNQAGLFEVGLLEFNSETKASFETFRKQAYDRHSAVDVNLNGVVDLEEARAPHAFDMVGLVQVADRNSDGALDKSELDAWVDLQAEFAKLTVQVQLKKLDKSLFVLMDRDLDGLLSEREIQSAGKLIADLAGDRLPIRQEALIDIVPAHWQVEIAGGKVKGDSPKSDQRIPYWFRGMDKNRDGDVSQIEFLGSDEKFEQFDRNQDGYLSPNELH